MPYSEFLGLHVTNGVKQKTENLSNIITQPVMLRFLLQAVSDRRKPGHQKLVAYLASLGISVDKHGLLTANAGSSKAAER